MTKTYLADRCSHRRHQLRHDFLRHLLHLYVLVFTSNVIRPSRPKYGKERINFSENYANCARTLGIRCKQKIPLMGVSALLGTPSILVSILVYY